MDVDALTEEYEVARRRAEVAQARCDENATDIAAFQWARACIQKRTDQWWRVFGTRRLLEHVIILDAEIDRCLAVGGTLAGTVTETARDAERVRTRLAAARTAARDRRTMREHQRDGGLAEHLLAPRRSS